MCILDTIWTPLLKWAKVYFLYTLRDKKLEKGNLFPDQDWEISLEKNLRTENPEDLFEAISMNNRLL
jgi:hypothetical protein